MPHDSAEPTENDARQHNTHRATPEPAPGDDSPATDAARIAVAGRLCNVLGRQHRPHPLPGATLRLLIALDAAADEHGRFRTAYGQNVLFEKGQYYTYLGRLEAAGYLTRPAARFTQRRELTITSDGRRYAAKVLRRIEAAAREFLLYSRWE